MNDMRIQLVAFDLDGTVLDSDEGISAPTAAAMQAAAKRGVVFAAATGRSPGLIPPSISSLPCIQYAICANGAYIQRLSDRKPLETSPLSPEAIRQAIALARPSGAALVAFTAEYSICERAGLVRLGVNRLQEGESTDPQPKERRRSQIVEDGTSQILTADSPILKLICVYPSPAEGERMLPLFQSLPMVEAVTTTGLDLEVTAAGVTKGAGIAALAKRLDIPKDRILALGDSGNDISMREYVGTFVAMGNATQDVKQAADYITGCVWEDGAAHALERLLGNCDWKEGTL